MNLSPPAPGRTTPRSLADFDRASGSWLERLLFNHRAGVLVLCALITALLGWQATRLQLNASFEKTIPTRHPYVRNFLAHQSELTGLGNAVTSRSPRPATRFSIRATSTACAASAKRHS